MIIPLMHPLLYCNAYVTRMKNWRQGKVRFWFTYCRTFPVKIMLAYVLRHTVSSQSSTARPRSVPVLLDRGTPAQVSVPVSRCSPVSFISSMPHTQVYLRVHRFSPQWHFTHAPYSGLSPSPSVFPLSLPFHQCSTICIHISAT